MIIIFININNLILSKPRSIIEDNTLSQKTNEDRKKNSNALFKKQQIKKEDTRYKEWNKKNFNDNRSSENTETENIEKIENIEEKRVKIIKITIIIVIIIIIIIVLGVLYKKKSDANKSKKESKTTKNEPEPTSNPQKYDQPPKSNDPDKLNASKYNDALYKLYNNAKSKRIDPSGPKLIKPRYFDLKNTNPDYDPIFKLFINLCNKTSSMSKTLQEKINKQLLEIESKIAIAKNTEDFNNILLELKIILELPIEEYIKEKIQQNKDFIFFDDTIEKIIKYIEKELDNILQSITNNEQLKEIIKLIYPNSRCLIDLLNLHPDLDLKEMIEILKMADFINKPEILAINQDQIFKEYQREELISLLEFQKEMTNNIESIIRNKEKITKIIKEKKLISKLKYYIKVKNLLLNNIYWIYWNTENLKHQKMISNLIFDDLSSDFNEIRKIILEK